MRGDVYDEASNGKHTNESAHLYISTKWEMTELQKTHMDEAHQ